MVVAATMTGCVVSIAWIVAPQPSGENTLNGWSNFIRTRGNLRPLPAHRIDHETGSNLGEVGRSAGAAVSHFADSLWASS